MVIRAFLSAVLLFSVSLNMSDDPLVGIVRLDDNFPWFSALAWFWFIWASLWCINDDYTGFSMRNFGQWDSINNMLGCLIYVAFFHVMILWWWV